MRDCKVEEIMVKSNLRGSMDDVKLSELSTSIAEKGILQPLVARPVNGGAKIELVCGHRRLKAAVMAGMKTVPVIVKDLTDEEVTEVQVIENLQRTDLNPVDEARGLSEMLKMNKYTHKDLGSKVGKSASYVGDRIELLKLDEKMLGAVYDGTMTPAHAKVLLRIKDIKDRKELFNDIVREKLSARAAENSLVEDGYRNTGNYGKDLDDAIFDKGKCNECQSNGSNYKDLIDPDTQTKGKCFNKQCYLKKWNDKVNEQAEKQKKDGLRVIKEETAYKKTERYNTEEFDDETIRMLGTSFKEECRKCKDFAVVIKKGYQGKTELETRCFNPKCLKARISLGKKELTKARSAAEKEGTGSKKKAGPDPQLVAMRKARDITRKTLSARAFWINVLFSSRTERMANTLVLSGILQSLTYSGRERVLNKELGITKEIRGVAALYKVTTNEQVLKCIQAVCSSKISEHSSADLEFLASEAKKTIAKDFVITNDYLEKLNKEQLVALAKEIKLDKALVKAGRDPGKMFNVKKDVLVTYFTGGTMKIDGIVPKEMVAFTGKKANNY